MSVMVEASQVLQGEHLVVRGEVELALEEREFLAAEAHVV